MKRRRPSTKKTRPPKRPIRRRNSAEAAAAAELYEDFHGRPASHTRTHAETIRERDELADLGRLIELQVFTDPRHLATLAFSGNVRLAAAPDGGQLYIVGGDQRIDLAALGLAKYLPKDHLLIGQVKRITYHTSKSFHDFQPIDYVHEFAEDGGDYPCLNYDTLNHKLYLTGGSYRVQPEGIVN